MGAGSINAPRAVKITEPFGLEGDNWQHSEGEECFERTIDPELYPPRVDR